MHAKYFSVLTVTILASAALAQLPETTHYLGTIDELPITMSLTINDHKIDGTYLYARRGHELNLLGGLDYGLSHTYYNFTETTDTAKTTGKFQLSPRADDSLAGTWKSPDGKKSLAVNLIPVAKTVTILSAVSDRYEINTGCLHFLKATPFHAALNDYLQATAHQFHNQQLQSYSAGTAGRDAGVLPWVSNQISCLYYASNALVSIRAQVTEFTGGAKGSHAYSALNFAWSNDKLALLAATDLIAASNFPALRDMCIKDLKSQHASWPEKIKLDQAHPPILNFTAESLLVTFSPYEAGPDAEGTYVVCLPFVAVKPLVSKGSPLNALIP